MTGPQFLTRIIAGLGLALMLPLAVGLISGSLSATDAAIRAVSLYGGVVVARKLAGMAPTGREILIAAPEGEPETPGA